MSDTPDTAADERLSAVLAAAGASGTWNWDIAGDRFSCDERFAELYDLDPAQGRDGLPTNTFFSAIHPGDLARMKIAVAGILGGAELFSKEFRIVRPDGAVLWMHGRGQGHEGVEERPVRFTGLLVDVTERKRTEERLRVAQSAGGIGTFEYIDGFATASISADFCRLLGLHPATVLPIRTINALVRSGPGIIPEDDDHGWTKRSLDAEFTIVRADNGETRWIARRGEIVRDSVSSGYRFIGVIYDITALKVTEEKLRTLNETLEARVEQEIAVRLAAEDALRQAQKMEAVGHLTGGIAHDFNNLLTIIIGNIDTLGRRMAADTDPRTRRSLDNALSGAQRAAALTQRLLAFSRQQPLDPRLVDPRDLLSGMSDLLMRSINETIAIQIEARAGLWQIEVDPNQLENAILNLAVNARDAMEGGGQLTVTARNLELAVGDPVGEVPPGSYVRIAVEDTGSGMDADTMGKVFEPFFTTKEVGKGTGLGLSMVYGFVKQSGGHIHITSVPWRGTCVALFLPRCVERCADPDEKHIAPTRKGSRSETVLVVEDDDDVRSFTVETLRELGYRVMEAHDGEAALRLLEKQDQPVQLLLTDVVMPVLSGKDLAVLASAVQPSLRVLFTSGYTRDAIMKDGRLEVGVDLLSKPFTHATLAARVREVLDR